MKINAKRACQEATILKILIEIAEIGIKEGDCSSIVSKLRNKANQLFYKTIDNDKKLEFRCLKASHFIFLVFRNEKTKEVNTHKMILALHQIGDWLIDNNLFSEESRELLQEFLTIEGKQDETFDGKVITNEDWIKLKNSADKRVKDVIEIIKNI